MLDRIAAEVNGEIILQSEVSERVFQMKTSGRLLNVSDKEAADKVLNEMIDEKLIIQFAKEKEIKVTGREIDEMMNASRLRMNLGQKEFEQTVGRQGLTMERYRKMLEEQKLAQKVLSREVRSQVQIAPESMEDYYNENKKLFHTPVTVRARHILIQVAKGVSQEEDSRKLNRLLEIRQEIEKGLPFSEAAKRYSQGPSGKDGGDLGVVTPGQMVAPFEKVAFSLGIDVLSEPVRTRFGYHLILVEKKTDSYLPPYEDIKKKVQNKMYRNLISEVRDDWLARIKKKAFIDIKTGAN